MLSTKATGYSWSFLDGSRRGSLIQIIIFIFLRNENIQIEILFL